ncbi:hypothetical protein FO519_003710 [Halicephalobus sp. NKZ332]|nr:hypothetical protein FO519_003710 [Halicephalobus sp. NKZ332]
MSYKAIVHLDDPEKGSISEAETELHESELLLLDFVMNNFLRTLNLPPNSKYDYFKYIDEDGELITVQKEEDLTGFTDSYVDPGTPLHVYLASTRIETINEEDKDIGIRISDLSNQKEIGRGQFGSVYKAFSQKLNQWIAVKSLSGSMFSLQQEIDILKMCGSCDKIVKYLGASQNDGILHIFLEFMDGLSLDKYGKIPLKVLGLVNVEVVDALTFMWRRNMIHRDIKPSNFLVNSSGEVKLADFGVSRTMLFSQVRSCVGTEAYLSPERMRGERYTIASDVWSLGLSLVEMALGKPPTLFINTSEQIHDVSDFIVKSMSMILSSLSEIDSSMLLQSFVDGCLKSNPSSRLKALELGKSDFVLKYTPVDSGCIAAFMKNLHLYTASSTIRVSSSGGEGSTIDLSNAAAFCVDSASALTYFLVPGEVVSVNSQMEVEGRIPWSTPEDGKVVLFDFLVDDMTICAVFENGEVYLISTFDGNIAEEPVLCGHTVVGGSWSPDLGLLIIATTEKLLAITRNFEIEHEVDLYFQDPGREQLMTIGWGARETQFQGSAGRQKREKVDENTIPGPLSSKDDKEAIVSWRADCQYFTVSTVEERSNPRKLEKPDDPEKIECRHLRVWNRDLELMSQCEEVAGMEKSLSMKPVGNIMAVTRVMNNKRDVWFYERNGQWRHNFFAGDSDADVISVKWNSDGSVLLLHLRRNNIDLLQFWMVSNYDWALKVELERDNLKEVKWNPEMPYRLHFLSNSGRYDIIELESGYNTLDGIVVSVAGGTIRVSNMPVSPIPPPMSHYQLNIGKTGVQLVAQSRLGLALLLSDGRLATYKGTKYEPFSIVKLVRSTSGICFNLAWVDEENISLIANNRIFQYNISSGEERLVYVSESSIIYQKYSSPSWFIEKSDGRWLELISGEIKETSINFGGENIYKCEVIKTENRNLFFGINRNNQLIVNGYVIHQSIGSYVFEESGFLIVSQNNQLFGMKYSDLIELLKNPPKMTSKNSGYGWFNEGAGRNVPKGAVIAAEPKGVRIFLQTTRGDLETIEPRFRIIPWLKELINGEEYGKAIRLMKRQRVDMNLLYDHDPESFKRNIKKFIELVDDAELLNLFVFGLNDEDSTRKNFLPYYPERRESPFLVEKKVVSVSELVLRQILEIESIEKRHRLYTAALSCFLNREPRCVKDAFLNMKEQIEAAGVPLKQTNEQFLEQKPSLLRKWTKHVKYYLKDIELFRGALLTYDLTLAYEVADCINMDPREFLPLLDSLHEKHPEDYMKFHVDVYVENYVSALENISKVDEKIDECIDHIKKYNLYSKAINIFHGSKNFETIAKLCGEYALSQRSFDEAGILFEKAKDYDNALKAYDLSLNLNGFLFAAKKIPLDPDTLKRNLTVFALKFEQQSKFVQAAEAYKELGVEDHLVKVVENYARVSEWKLAINELKKNDEKEIFKEGKQKLMRDIVSNVKFIDQEVKEMREKVLKYSNRLEMIRNSKEKQVEEWIENEGEIDVAQSETMSQVSSASGMSNISRLSKMSTAQVKRRQNVERHKKNIKEGSQYEDIGILTAMTEIVKKLNGIQKDLEQLLPVLVDLDLLKEAKNIQSEVEKTVKLMADKRTQIWPRHLKAKHLTGPMVEIYRCEDGLVRIPGEDHMPSRIYIEDEMVPPKLDISYNWKLKCLE